MSQSEKKLKSSIAKSLRYFQLKASFNKELKFFLLKVEGLKSCLKEAKTAYQQSLTNLEKISTEVHEQRNTRKTTSDTSLKSSNSSLSAKPDASNVTSVSSPNLRSLDEAPQESRAKSVSMTQLGDISKSSDCAEETTEEEADYDRYFAEQQLKNEFENGLVYGKTVHCSQKVDPNAVCLLSDEEIACLGMEKRLRRFANELLGRRVTEEVVAQPVIVVVKREETGTMEAAAGSSGVRVTVPNLSKMKYM